MLIRYSFYIFLIFITLTLSCTITYTSNKAKYIKKNYCFFYTDGSGPYRVHKNYIPDDCKSCDTTGLIANEIKAYYENKYKKLIVCPLIKHDSIKIYTYYLNTYKPKIGYYIKAKQNEIIEDSLQLSLISNRLKIAGIRNKKIKSFEKKVIRITSEYKRSKMPFDF